MKIMEQYQRIIPDNIDKTFLINGTNFQNLRDFFYYCCYSFVKSSCDHSIDHALYINTNQLMCDYPITNSTEELLFELKKHSHVFDYFVDGPIIIFEFENHNVSNLNTFQEFSNHDKIGTILATFMCSLMIFVAFLYCMITKHKNKLQTFLSYEEINDKL